MITLTSSQKEIQKRLFKDIDREIGMCDDYADLMIVATTLYDKSKHILKFLRITEVRQQKTVDIL